MFSGIHGADAKVLNKQDYLDDFYRVLEGDIQRFEKLERGQFFQEPGVDSWDAFHRGDWPTALSLIEDSRSSFIEYYDAMTRRGFTCRRVRVVEIPVTPYLRWEMQVLRLRAELGEDIRVVDAGSLQTVERDRPVPEIVILGSSAMYEVIYNEMGISDGARRFVDPDLIEKTATEINTLVQPGGRFLPVL